jgi:fimbrial chaperone protein
VSLSAARPVTLVTLRNEGSEPSVVQLEVASWGQTAADDVYEPTTDLLATPPIFTVPPGQSQVIRVGLRRAPDSRRELDYRLFLQEVPPPAPAGFQGMRVALRISVPVFVAPPAKAKPEPKWRTVSNSNGSVTVSLENNGTEHVKIANLELTTQDGASASAVQQVATYVLPGQTRQWHVQPLVPLSAGSRIRLRAHSDTNSELGADLTLDAP